MTGKPVVLGGIGIFLFSGLLPNHSAFDLGLPVAAYGALWSGAVTYPRGGGSTLAYSTPLILAGLMSLGVITASVHLALILAGALLASDVLGWRLVAAGPDRERLIVGSPR